MTIINRELHKLNIIIGVLLLPVVLVLALSMGDLYYLGLLVVLAVVTKTAGVQFDAKNRRYRKYTHFCGWTRGQWKNIGEKKELVILVKHGKQTTLGTMSTGEWITEGGFSELYLMDEHHLRRFFIDASENHESIELKAHKLSQLLDIEVKPFWPRA